MNVEHHTIYMVEDRGLYQPGHVYACFADEPDAFAFAGTNLTEGTWRVVPRTVWYGQPPNKGYNQ